MSISFLSVTSASEGVSCSGLTRRISAKVSRGVRCVALDLRWCVFV